MTDSAHSSPHPAAHATSGEAKSRDAQASDAKQPRPPKFSADERNAMRAFLQRSEVRLSTMHRVAVGFLSGAGLLFLYPIFLKDGVLDLVRALLEYQPSLPVNSPILGMIGAVVLYLCVLYPFLLALSLPAVALILLLEDIVRFYFVSHPPTFPEELFNPRFALTGVAFSTDESEAVKDRVLRYEYGTDLINFVVSRADARSRYYLDIIDKPRRLIVPTTRKLPRLIKTGVMQLAAPKPLENVQDDDHVLIQGTYTNGNDEENLLHTPLVKRTVREIDQFNAALGLAGFIDRPLYQEVAKTEVSLVRHSLKLRRLVLRYFQALLILLWTSLVTFLMLPFLQDTSGRFPVPVVFAVTYLLWAILAPTIVQQPLYWLVSHVQGEAKQAVESFSKSDALQTFGKLVQRLCYVAIATAGLALLLELFLQV